MAQRVVVRIDLNERRKLSPANILSSFTSWSKGTTRLQVRNVWRRSGYLIKLLIFVTVLTFQFTTDAGRT